MFAFGFFFLNYDTAYAAAPAVATAVIQDVGTSTFSMYLTGTSFNAFVSSTGYNANSTDLLGITYNSTHPDSAVIVEDGTIKHLTAVFPISASSSVSTNLTIAANTIRNSTTLNSLITKAINAFITLTEVSPVVSGPNATPSYTFNTTATGTIAYTGDCTSASTTAYTGNNTIIFNTLADGVHSNCRIQVTDSGGNVSSILTASSFTVGAIDGYVGQYWNLDEGSYNPSFPNRAPDLTRIDSTLYFYWNDGSPNALIHNDAFIVRWTKTVSFLAGTYHFHMDSDDGHRVYVDGELVSDYWSGGTSDDVKILTAGNHEIVVEYYENGGGANVNFRYYRELPGSGTSEDPYQITTCDDLQAVTFYLSSNSKLVGNVDCSGTATGNSFDRSNYSLSYGDGQTVTYYLYAKNIRQDREFSLALNGSVQATSTYSVDYVNGTVTFNSAPSGNLSANYSYYRGFEPIGNGSTFEGEFDGEGYTISGLNIDRQEVSDVALFSRSNGNIHDFILSNATIRGYGEVGGFIGATDNRAVTQNISISGIVQGWNEKIGGIVGANRQGSKILNATSTVQIIGSGQADRLGGIAGANGGFINNAFASSTVEGEYEVGGLVGRSGGGISNSYAIGNVNGKEDVGGLLGFNDGGTISNSHSTGNVYASYDNAGGLLGRNSRGAIVASYATGNVDVSIKGGGFVGANGGDIFNSYATGNASGTSEIGGFAGRNGGSVRNSYAVGAVTGSEDVGGFLGHMDTGEDLGHIIENSFWNVTTSGQEESAGGTGKTTEQLKTPITFSNAGWDLESAWRADPGSYPVLRNSPLFNSGSGTDEDPYHITNCTQLQNMDFNHYAVYELDNDINCSETSHWNSNGENYRGFKPIGSDEKTFGGKLDGNNHIISNLFINRPNDDYVGLFGTTEGSTLTRIYLKNVDITGSDRVGALVGDNDYNDDSDTLISHSGASGVVHGNYRTGGLVGTNHHHGIIETSFSIVDVTVGGYTGGGFIGASGGTIRNSYSAGSATGATGTNTIGGFAGQTGGTIENSYSIASSTIDGDPAYGFLGSSDGGNVENSYWDSEKTGLDSSAGGDSLDTASMKSQGYLTEAGWNFGEVWTIDENVNGGYPYLQGQIFISGDSDAPVITNTDVVASDTSAEFTWDTDEAASSKILYSIRNSNYSETDEEDTSTRVQSHSVTVNGLAACSTYFFKFYSADANSNVTVDSAAIFSTTGCSGGALPTDKTLHDVDTSGNATTTLSIDSNQFSVITAPGFTTATSSVVIQIRSLDKNTVLGSIGSPNGLSGAGSIVFDVKAMVDTDTVLDSFDTPVTITYHYSDSDVSGVNESTLWLYHYHGGSWSALDSCTVDTSANIITCTAPNFSVFSLFGQANPVATVSSSGGGGGGGVIYGCRDPKALNYQSVVASDPSSCKYSSVATATSTISTTVIPKTLKTTFTRDLNVGMSGKEVLALQNILILKNSGKMAQKLKQNSATGYFGTITKAALIEFQTLNKILPATGNFGPRTRVLVNSN